MSKLIALLAVTSLAVSPAAASVRDAAFASSSDRQAAQASLFAGGTYRLGLDRRTSEARARASLSFSGMTRTPDSGLKFSHGLEISRGQTGKPALFMAGQDVGQLKNKAQLSGTTTAIIIGGVLVLGLVAVLVVSDYQKDQRCIGEEGDCD